MMFENSRSNGERVADRKSCSLDSSARSPLTSSCLAQHPSEQPPPHDKTGKLKRQVLLDTTAASFPELAHPKNPEASLF